MIYFVYILQCSDGTYYVGYTTNIERRLHAHNFLKNGARYTRQRRPVILAYSEKFATKGDALKREYEIKQLKRAQKEDIIVTSSH